MDQRLKTILAELREGYESIYQDRLVDILLFGSQARGEPGSGSDIDVVVVLKGPVNPWDEIPRTSSFKANLCLKHEAVVSCVYVEEERFRHEQSPLLLNIRRDGIRV